MLSTLYKSHENPSLINNMQTFTIISLLFADNPILWVNYTRLARRQTKDQNARTRLVQGFRSVPDKHTNIHQKANIQNDIYIYYNQSDHWFKGDKPPVVVFDSYDGWTPMDVMETFVMERK